MSRATRAYSPAVKSSSGSRMSIRWCGIPRRSASGSFAVPISKWRYTCRESQLTISPSNSAASRRARSLLPEPVGPTTATSGQAAASGWIECGVFAVKPRYTMERGIFEPSAGCRAAEKESRVHDSFRQSAADRCFPERPHVRAGSGRYSHSRTTRPAPITTSPWAASTRSWRRRTATGRNTSTRPSALPGSAEAGSRARASVFEELTDLYIQTNHLRDAHHAGGGHAEDESGQCRCAPHAGPHLHEDDQHAATTGSTRTTSRRRIEQLEKVTAAGPQGRRELGGAGPPVSRLQQFGGRREVVQQGARGRAR